MKADHETKVIKADIMIMMIHHIVTMRMPPIAVPMLVPVSTVLMAFVFMAFMAAVVLVTTILVTFSVVISVIAMFFMWFSISTSLVMRFSSLMGKLLYDITFIPITVSFIRHRRVR
jgi:hypothetical protein